MWRTGLCLTDSSGMKAGWMEKKQGRNREAREEGQDKAPKGEGGLRSIWGDRWRVTIVLSNRSSADASSMVIPRSSAHRIINMLLLERIPFSSFSHSASLSSPSPATLISSPVYIPSISPSPHHSTLPSRLHITQWRSDLSDSS